MNSERIDYLLGNSIQNLILSYLDTFMKANAELGYKVGLNEKVTRTCIGVYNCKWCLSLQGIYNYPNVPNDVWKRHVDCDCLVTHLSDNGVQNVHTKNYMTQQEIKEIKIEHLNDTLTDEEKSAIRRYVSPSANKLNDKLRNGEPLTDFEKKWTKNIDNAIMKLPKRTGTVYRTIDASTPWFNEKEFLEIHKVGKIVTNKSYTSSGLMVYDKRHKYQLIIKSKRGANIIKYNKKELEILFSRNTNFYVEKVKGNKIWMIEV